MALFSLSLHVAAGMKMDSCMPFKFFVYILFSSVDEMLSHRLKQKQYENFIGRNLMHAELFKLK